MKPALLSFLILLGAYAPVGAEVRVLLFQTQTLRGLQLSSVSGFRVSDAKTLEPVLTTRPGENWTLQGSGTQLVFIGPRTVEWPEPIRIEPLRAQTGLRVSTPATPNRTYDGVLEVENRAHILKVIDRVADDDYMNSVVANEVPPGWPIEALKAQAVLARTYMACHRNRHHLEQADFCDLTHCQVYKGRALNAQVLAAVKDTLSLVLTFHGQPIDAVFHSCCGGRTTAGQEVWPSQAPAPYLVSVSDAGRQGNYCLASLDHDWTFTLSLRELGARLRSYGVSPSEKLAGLQVLRRDTTGRARSIQLTYADHAPSELSGDAFYRGWGHNGNWNQLKSTWFTVRVTGATCTFKGHGSGHGVGLCQWGARGRALAGWSYPEILKHYFPSTRLEPLSPQR